MGGFFTNFGRTKGEWCVGKYANFKRQKTRIPPPLHAWAAPTKWEGAYYSLREVRV